MTDIERIVWGGLAGVTVYVLGQLLSKFFLEPLHELRKEIGNIRFTLALHRKAIHTPAGRKCETSKAAEKALLECSCNLLAKLHGIPLYLIVRHICRLPKRKDMEYVSVQLRGLSTYVHEKGDEATENILAVNKRVCRIEKILRLQPLE